MRFLRPSTLLTAALTLALHAPGVMAQNLEVIKDLPGCDWITGRMEAKCIPVFIAHLIQLVFSVISVFFILNVIYSGYQIAFGYITGEKAQGIERLRWSIIGLVICVCSFLIINLAVSIVSP